MRKLGNWIESYQEFTRDFEPPQIFHRWVGLTAIAAVAGRKVWLEEANNQIFPNLYTVLVGPSGCGKGQAMREVIPFLDAAEVPRSPERVTMAKLVQDMSESPVAYEGGIVTPYLIWAEELPSWLGSDAHKSGKLADLTSLYDCAPKWESATKTQGVSTIASPYVCILAGSTEQGIMDVLPMEAAGQGFTSRVLFVVSQTYPRRIVEKPWGPHKQTLFDALRADFQHIGRIKGGRKLSDVARVYWADYYLHRPEPAQEYRDERMQGYAARKPFYTKKLALLLSMAESDEMVVEAHHLERARLLLRDIDTSTREIYLSMAPTKAQAHFAKVLKWLEKQPNKTASRVELARRFSYALPKLELDLCIDGLVEMRYVEVDYREGRGGKHAVHYRLVRELKEGELSE